MLAYCASYNIAKLKFSLCSDNMTRSGVICVGHRKNCLKPCVRCAKNVLVGIRVVF
jgi:hypothetical protein